MMLWACIVVRVLVNPLSNVFQKLLTGQGVPPLAVVGVTHVVLSAACLPLLLVGLPPAYFEFWLNMAICGVLAVAANVLLVKAVQLTDLSVLGPVNAYKAVVSIVPGIVLLGEVPSAAALVGIGLIVVGNHAFSLAIPSVYLADGPARTTVPADPNWPQTALAMIVLSKYGLPRALTIKRIGNSRASCEVSVRREGSGYVRHAGKRID
jgi:uncharacterized membrane protein